MRILVTGAAGFLGKNLVAELNNISEGKTAFDGIEKIIEKEDLDLFIMIFQISCYYSKTAVAILSFINYY